MLAYASMYITYYAQNHASTICQPLVIGTLNHEKMKLIHEKK